MTQNPGGFIRNVMYPILCMLTLFACTSDCDAKKIKQKLNIEKEGKTKSSGEIKSPSLNIRGYEINLLDSLENNEWKLHYPSFRPEDISFSGYDKEANSSKESFLVVNDSGNKLTGIKVRIDYLDMKGRMLHSRELTEICEVPAGEVRKIDTSSWDVQKTYYYYLGNSPKKTATPYKVVFIPLSYWIEE